MQRKVGLQCSLNMSFDREIMFCSLPAIVSYSFFLMFLYLKLHEFMRTKHV